MERLEFDAGAAQPSPTSGLEFPAGTKGPALDSSLEIMAPAKKGDGFRTEPTGFFARCCFNFVNCCLFAFKIRTAEREITDDAIYDRLDNCLSNPNDFRKILLTTSSLEPTHFPNADATSLFILLCACENKVLQIPNSGSIKVGTTIIGYVLTKERENLNFKTRNKLNETIFYYIKSTDTLNILIGNFPDLKEQRDDWERTPLYLYATRDDIRLTPDERLKFVKTLLSQGADIRARDKLGNSIVHLCANQKIAELLLAKRPTLIFSLNNMYQLPAEVNLALGAYLIQFAATHNNLYPDDVDVLLEIEIARAIILRADSSNYMNDLQKAKDLIREGANLSAPLTIGDVEKPIFHHIIDRSGDEYWKKLLNIAIAQAIPEQISEALEYTIISMLDGKSEEHWFYAARQLIEKSKNPESMEIRGETLKHWDGVKNWKLFPQ